MKGCLEIRIQINKKIINFPMHYYYLEHEYSLSFVKGYSISPVLVSCNFFFFNDTVGKRMQKYLRHIKCLI